MINGLIHWRYTKFINSYKNNNIASKYKAKNPDKPITIGNFKTCLSVTDRKKENW